MTRIALFIGLAVIFATLCIEPTKAGSTEQVLRRKRTPFAANEGGEGNSGMLTHFITKRATWHYKNTNRAARIKKLRALRTYRCRNIYSLLANCKRVKRKRFCMRCMFLMQYLDVIP